MKFEEVLPALRAGKKITNSYMRKEGWSAKIQNNRMEMLNSENEYIGYFDYFLNYHTILANDWEVCDD